MWNVGSGEVGLKWGQGFTVPGRAHWGVLGVARVAHLGWARDCPHYN